MASVLSAPHFHNEDAAYEFVEARLWPNGPTCPHCGATKEHVGRLKGKTTRAGLRKCYACRKPFTVKIGTVFEASHAPLRIWLQAIHLILLQQEGHQHPPTPAYPRRRDEDRMVSRSPYPRDDEDR